MTTEIVKANFDVNGLLIGIEGEVLEFENRTVKAKEIKDVLGVSVHNLESIIDVKDSTRILAKKINLSENIWPEIRFNMLSSENPSGFDFNQNSYEMVIPRAVNVLKAGKLRKPTEELQVTRK